MLAEMFHCFRELPWIMPGEGKYRSRRFAKYACGPRYLLPVQGNWGSGNKKTSPDRTDRGLERETGFEPATLSLGS